MASGLPNFILAVAATVQLVWCGAAAAAVPANKAEIRSYLVKIDNKPAGKYQLRLTDSADGVEVGSQCDLDYKFLIFRYKYSYRGSEKWKGARLIAFSSNSTEDGKRCAVAVQPEANGLQLTVDGKSRSLPASILTSSYWRLPQEGSFSAAFLEVDTGRVFNARFDFVGEEQLNSLNCKHYKLSGDDEGELWYDKRNRLVKQTSSSDGHKTAVELQSISSD